MKFYRFILIFFISLSFFMSYNLTKLNSISKDSTPPSIKIITPTKSQGHIISRPTIKASFSDKSGVDLRSVRLYVNNKDVTNKAQIKKNNIEYTPSKKFKRGTQIVKLSISDKVHNSTSLEWYFTVGTPIYKDFKGNFVDIEDINKSKSKIYKEPKFYKSSDYIIINKFINSSKKSLKEFEDTIKQNTKGKFIFLDALKIPLYLSKDRITIYNENEDENYKDISKFNFNILYKNLFYKDDLICSFNPKSNDLNVFNYMKYSHYGDAVFSLLYITNKSPNLDSPFYLDIYNEALNNGWHISPISSNYTTKILATDLNKDSLLDSLKNRRTYVTNNQNLDLEFTINSSNMGYVIKNPSKLNFNISAVDSSYKNIIKNIYIVSNNNKIIKNINCNSYLAKSEFTLTEFEKYSYYYLIIKQNNNKMTVSAPIWVEID